MKPQNPDSKIDKMFLSFLSWREKYVGERTFVIFLALLVGILSGFAAIVLKFLIHTISTLLLSHVNISEGNHLFIIFPAVGVILAGLYVRYLVRDNISHGVTRVLYAISQNKSRLKKHNMYTSVIASSITDRKSVV